MKFFKTASNLLLWEHAIFQLIKLGSALGVLPFKIDITHRLFCHAGVFRKTVWYFLLLYYSLDIIYLASVAKLVTLLDFDETEFVNFYLHFLSRLTAGVLAIILASVKDSVMQLYNLLIQYQRKHSGVFVLIINFVNNKFKF